MDRVVAGAAVDEVAQPVPGQRVVERGAADVLDIDQGVAGRITADDNARQIDRHCRSGVEVTGHVARARATVKEVAALAALQDVIALATKEKVVASISLQ